MGGKKLDLKVYRADVERWNRMQVAETVANMEARVKWIEDFYEDGL